MLEISKPVYEFLVYQGVDSFLFDPPSKTHFLMYWDGSLFNHCKDSAATFMNLRPGGLTCKYVVEYKQYTKEVDMFNAEENRTYSNMESKHTKPLVALTLCHILSFIIMMIFVKSLNM